VQISGFYCYYFALLLHLSTLCRTVIQVPRPLIVHPANGWTDLKTPIALTKSVKTISWPI